MWKALSCFLVFVILMSAMLVSVFAQDATMSKPVIPSGTEISKADSVAVTSELQGSFGVSLLEQLIFHFAPTEDINLRLTYTIEPLEPPTKSF